MVAQEMKVMTKTAWSAFVDRLIAEDGRRVVGVLRRGGRYAFGDLASAEDLVLDYDVTILPPKKYFFPPREALVAYEVGEGLTTEAVIASEPLIILGVHPYDIHALAQMDAVFREGYEDRNYLAKREASVIVGVNLIHPSERCFAGSMGTATVEEGYDLMLTDVGDAYVIAVGTHAGGDLLERYGGGARDASPADLARAESSVAAALERIRCSVEVPLTELPELVRAHIKDDPFWDARAEACLSCGTCVTTCPTCYCFDIRDEPDLSLTSGRRVRYWDGCMLADFAAVAGGENFRGRKGQRYRHRYLKKAVYLFDRFGFVACVGCGRCSSQCLPDIADPVKVFNALKGGRP